MIVNDWNEWGGEYEPITQPSPIFRQLCRLGSLKSVTNGCILGKTLILFKRWTDNFMGGTGMLYLYILIVIIEGKLIKGGYNF